MAVRTVYSAGTRNNSDTESVHDLQRQLHTLKGGARMADLTPIGNLTHALESLIISVNEGQLDFTKDMSYLIHDSMDRLSDMLAKVKARQPISSEDRLIEAIEALRRGEEVDVKKSEEPEPAQEEAKEEISFEEISSIEFDEDEAFEPVAFDDEKDLSLEISDELIIEEPSSEEELEPEVEDLVVSPEPEMPLEPESKPQETLIAEPTSKETFHLEKQAIPAAKPKEEAKSGIAHEQVRVRSDLLNDLVNHAGEVSVYHARMGQQISNFSFNLSEMDQTVIRLREQLRKLSIETEAQILSRYEKESDQYDEHFDPLEMDRFSTMQQLSRSLQETVEISKV